MYRDANLRRYQYYVNPSWAGSFLYFCLLKFLLNAKQAVYTQAPVSQAPGLYMHTFHRNLLKILFRPGALIAGTWAVMQHMGSQYVYHGPHFIFACSFCNYIIEATLTRAAPSSLPRAPSPKPLPHPSQSSMSLATRRRLLLRLHPSIQM